MMSAMGCANWMPRMPIIWGKMRTTGIRKMPCLAIPRMDARTTFPMVCIIILLMMSQPKKGR